MEEKKDAKPAEPAAVEVKKAKRRKKIRELSLEEVEEKIKDTENKMGSRSSIYARHLLSRKSELEKK